MYRLTVPLPAYESWGNKKIYLSDDFSTIIEDLEKDNIRYEIRQEKRGRVLYREATSK